MTLRNEMGRGHIPLDPSDPEPLPRGPVRYFDPEGHPMDRVWLFLLRFVPKPLRYHWPFDGFFHQPDHLAWAKREGARMYDLFNPKDE